MSKKKQKRPWAVFIAIALAVLFGSWAGKDASIFGVSFYTLFDLLGKMFLNALTLVVVPLVSSSIITGISRIGNLIQYQNQIIRTRIPIRFFLPDPDSDHTLRMNRVRDLFKSSFRYFKHLDRSIL